MSDERKENGFYPLAREGMLVNLTGYWRETRPYREERLSPCRAACPAGEDIPTYIAHALAGDFEQAFLTICEENPLPAVCGRVCYHPCEGSCLRKQLDEAVTIHWIERFAGDYGLTHLAFSPPEKESGARVAVVGSGPAGLSCAYHLRRLGHGVTIFEAEAGLGGMLRQGIPPYRLPRDILDRNINMILNIGVETRTSFRVGDESSRNALEGFDAVFLAPGAQRSTIPSIPGVDLPTVTNGLDFLKKVNNGTLSRIGRRIAVIGGGNTAVDAARVAVRMGAEVMLVYRRSIADMPASREEVQDALDEGVRIMDRMAPLSMASSDEALRLTCARTVAGEADESGRPKYTADSGSSVEIGIDSVILAIGQSVEALGFEGVPAGSDTISTTNFLRIGKDKYFAGGDAVPGPRRVCDAVGSGKLAALSIHSTLSGSDMKSIWPLVQLGDGITFSMRAFFRGDTSPDPRLGKPVQPEEVKPDRFTISPSPQPPKLAPERAVEGFDEVSGKLDRNQVKEAAERCFSCGTCTKCDICRDFCPDMSVRKLPDGYEYNYDYCKGCAICAEECPRGVIHLEAEES